MKTAIAFIIVAALLLPAALVLPGCGNPEAKARVDEAVGLIASSESLMDDLLDLDRRLNTLGTRFSRVEDTIAEGKSLAQMALAEVGELEARYGKARDILREVADMGGAGKYAEYALLALEAVENGLAALDLNRRLLNTVWDMLDVLPLAESGEQLSYYTAEIDRLTGEISDLLQRAAEAAAEADRFYGEKGL